MGKVGWKDFVVWQCSIRQRNFRLHKGKPSEGLICNLYEKKNNIEIKKFISYSSEKYVNVKDAIIIPTAANGTINFKVPKSYSFLYL